MRMLSYYGKRICLLLVIVTASIVSVSQIFSLPVRKATATTSESGSETGKADRLEQVREKSLEREQKAQEKRAGIDSRSVKEVEEQATPNRYTQTEAYFQMPAMRELVLETFDEGSYKPVYHMDVISRVMAKEAALNDKYWVFYHAHVNDWMVPQDVFKELNNHFKASSKAGDDFIFLRFTDQELPRAQELLEETMKESGLIDDNGNAKGMLLSANLSLFGNTAYKGESTWRYFMTSIVHEPFKRAILEEIMTKFGVTHKYIDELIALIEDLRTKTQTLVQICIPKNMIDDIGYLSYATGIPAHAETIDWIRTNVKNKVYKAKMAEQKTAVMVALEDLQQKFQKQREKNPLYKDIMQSIENGDYSLDAYLKIYCNKPWELPNLNYMQARLVLSNDLLLNPNTGIKMFRYTKLKPYKMEAYKKRLHDIVQKIIAEKEPRK